MKILLLLSIFATGFSVELSSPSTPSTTTLRNAETTLSSSPTLQVRKCCPYGKRLNSSDPTVPRCVQHSSSFQGMNIVGLNLTKDPGSRRVDLTLAYDSRQPGMPECKGSKVVSVLAENSWLTVKGNLVQDSQEDEMRHYEFCVDLIDNDDGADAESTDTQFGAVSCAACTEDHPCVNLCCPHGTALVVNHDEDPTQPIQICGTKTLNESFSPEFWSEHDMQMEEYGKEHGFILKAPAAKEGAGFRCPESHMEEFL